ncbi:MAG: hypothetical protein K0Q71_2528 [Thermomicrobiales bacterium]|nr:hypothetical protein [Thermomicrobiales bacterium]
MATMIASYQHISQAVRVDRTELGKRLREKVPRSDHATLPACESRADPLALVRQANHRRATHLVSLRYGRMAASPFAFLRGTAVVMAQDLARTPTTGIAVQLCGDAHIGNFGGYGTAERSLVFDLNDFDETHVGPWEWDVKRLVTSAVVLGRERKIKSEDRRRIACATVEAYRERMRELGDAPYLDIWLTPILAETAVDRFAADAEPIARAFAEGQDRTNLSAREKLAESRHGRLRFRHDPPLIARRVDRLRREVDDVVAGYRRSLPVDRRVLFDRYNLIDVARKVVGIGSIGLGTYVLLLQGVDDEDPLILQLKEARGSVLAPHVNASRFSHNGQRVVAGQRIMQAASDPFLGWTRFAGRDYYVRQLRDMKSTVPLHELDADGLQAYAVLCAHVLARAHACSADAALIGGYLGRGAQFDHAVAEFAEGYADIVERDHQGLLDAIAKGSVNAARER